MDLDLHVLRGLDQDQVFSQQFGPVPFFFFKVASGFYPIYPDYILIISLFISKERTNIRMDPDPVFFRGSDWIRFFLKGRIRVNSARICNPGWKQLTEKEFSHILLERWRHGKCRRGIVPSYLSNFVQFFVKSNTNISMLRWPFAVFNGFNWQMEELNICIEILYENSFNGFRWFNWWLDKLFFEAAN